MGHHCCSKQKVKRGLWSPEEDEKLLKFITTHGHGCWSSVPKLAGLQRCGKSCRLRWINYLRPDLKKGSFSAHEERIIIDVHRILGNRWAQIAKHLPGRTDNEVKNFWNSCIKKKLIAQGLDPKTHNLMPSSNSRPSNNNVNVISNLSQFLQTHSPHTTTPFTISSNIKSFDTTTKSNSMTDQNAIPPPFVTLTTPSASILPLHESNNMPTFQYQDPNVLMSFKDQLDPHESLMDYNNICSSSSMENTNNFNHSDFVDESCMWGGSHDIDPLEDTKQNGEELQQQFQRHGQSSNAMNGEGINKGVVEMEMSYDSSTFDLELMDSALLPCGMFSENTMEQLQWEC